MSIRSIYESVARWFVLDFAGKIRWKLKGGLTDEDRAKIQELLTKDYYVILTHRKNHLSTYMVSLGNFLLTGKFGFWSHTLMNLEDKVASRDDFRLIEAIGTGVEYTPFDQVFDVDSVCLLKPKRVSLNEWTLAMNASKTFLGRKYDTLFDLASENELSCVELVRAAISRIPGYKVLFADFEESIERRKNLTPQMYYDCDDFQTVYEVRR